MIGRDVKIGIIAFGLAEAGDRVAGGRRKSNQLRSGLSAALSHSDHPAAIARPLHRDVIASRPQEGSSGRPQGCCACRWVVSPSLALPCPLPVPVARVRVLQRHQALRAAPGAAPVQRIYPSSQPQVIGITSKSQLAAGSLKSSSIGLPSVSMMMC
jgi:hypothetical protein